MATKQWASQLHYKHTDHMKVNNTPTMRRNEKKKYQMKIRNINLANAQNTNEQTQKQKQKHVTTRENPVPHKPWRRVTNPAA